jgi:hypothetical protein
MCREITGSIWRGENRANTINMTSMTRIVGMGMGMGMGTAGATSMTIRIKPLQQGE